MTARASVPVGSLPLPAPPAGARRVLSLLRRRRRGVSAVLLAAAAGLTVQAMAAEPAAGVAVVVAAQDLPAGTALDEQHLAVVHLPADAVPDGALSRAEALERSLSGPARRGEPITDARLTGPTQLTAAPRGTLAVPLPLTETIAMAPVRAGDRVRVIAGSGVTDGLDPSAAQSAEVLVDAAVVLAAPEAGDGGLLRGPTATAGQGVLLLALSTADAVRLADAAGWRPLSVALLP